MRARSQLKARRSHRRGNVCARARVWVRAIVCVRACARVCMALMCLRQLYSPRRPREHADFSLVAESAWGDCHRLCKTGRAHVCSGGDARPSTAGLALSHALRRESGPVHEFAVDAGRPLDACPQLIVRALAAIRAAAAGAGIVVRLNFPLRRSHVGGASCVCVCVCVCACARACVCVCLCWYARTSVYMNAHVTLCRCEGDV